MTIQCPKGFRHPLQKQKCQFIVNDIVTSWQFIIKNFCVPNSVGIFLRFYLGWAGKFVTKNSHIEQK